MSGEPDKSYQSMIAGLRDWSAPCSNSVTVKTSIWPNESWTRLNRPA